MKARQVWYRSRGWRRVLAGGLGCLFALSLAGMAHAAAFRVQSVRGQVEILRGGRGRWVRLGGGTVAASAGDHVRTGRNGSVTIIRDGGQRVTLSANTEVILREPGGGSGFRLVVGRALTAFNGRQRLEVRAPAAVAAAEGTIFQLEASEDGLTVLTVVEGEVRFFNDLGNVLVLTAQQSTARPGQAPTRPVVVDAASLTAWEVSLPTLLIEVEPPQVGADAKQLEQELKQRQETLQRRPDDPAAHAAVSSTLLGLGRAEEAVAEAQKAVDLASDKGLFRGALGYALLQAGRPGEAQEQFAQAAEGEPGNPSWQLGLGLVALGQRDSKPAIPFLRRAAELATADPHPWAYLTAALLRSGDLAGADRAATEAMRLGPTDSLANAYLAYVRLAQAKVKDAVAAGRVAVQAAPRSALAHQALGTAEFYGGAMAQAREDLQTAVQLNGLSAGAHLGLAKLLAANQELEEALSEAQLAVSLDPQSAPAHSTLGLLYLLNKDPWRAGKQFQQALAADPSLAEARTGWGRVLTRQGHFKEALDQQKAAVSLDTGSASAHNNLGGVYTSLGKMPQAVEELQEAIRLQPGWGMPYANLAVVWLEQNRYPEALQAAEKAVTLGERSPFVHTVLARIYTYQGRTDRAFAELRQAVALDPRYPPAHFQLAKLYLGQNRARDAQREILTSVATDPFAMLETRLYARTENTLSGGSYRDLHDDIHTSGQADEGRLSYFASGMAENSGGWRDVNQQQSERFLELIAGYQDSPKSQLALFGTAYRNRGGLPGPVGNPLSLAGDVDDRQAYDGWDVALAYRQRLSRRVTALVKWDSLHSALDYRNPDSLTAADSNPIQQLGNTETDHSPELRVDADLGNGRSLSAGYSHQWSSTRRSGTAGALNPDTGATVFTPFTGSASPGTNTAWLEAKSRFGDRLEVTVGGWWGREEGAPRVALPKVVAVYRPDPQTWLSFIANPLFRPDALELAPVEALADTGGLTYLNFAEGGALRHYELRYQRQGGASSTLTASLAHQRVRGLLLDQQDPGLTGLPTRLLVDRGYRWIGDVAYEQWISSTLSGRAWVQWQSSNGDFSDAGVTGMTWPYSPRWQAGWRLDYITPRGLTVGLDASWVGSRYHNAQNWQSVGGYALANLRVQYQRTMQENYFLQVGNLLGHPYDTFLGFPQPGRSVSGGVVYRF